MDKELKSHSEVVELISEVLMLVDHKFLLEIAGKVITEKLTYVGDGLYEIDETEDINF